MKCPKCKGKTDLQKRQVGLDDYHEPVYNEFAICRPCKKQWNLDEIRAKKAEKADSKKAAEAVANLRPIGYNSSKEKRTTAEPDKKNPKQSTNKSSQHLSSSNVRKPTGRPTGQSHLNRERVPRKENFEKPVLLSVRMVFCVVSLLGFGYWIAQGFRAGLDGIEGIPSEYSNIYIILAICFLVAAVFWWLLRGRNAFYVYLLPMISYFVGAFVTFSHRAEASHLLIATIVSAIFAILCVLVAALAKTVQ